MNNAALSARRREPKPMANGKTSLKTVSGSRFKGANLAELNSLVRERLGSNYPPLLPGIRFVDGGSGGLVLQLAAPYMVDLVNPYLEIIADCAREAMGGRRVAVEPKVSGDGFPTARIGGLLQEHYKAITAHLRSLVDDEDAFNAWLLPNSYYPEKGGMVGVNTESPISASTCERKYQAATQEAVATVFGPHVRVRFFFQKFPDSRPDNVVHHDPEIRERVQKNGGYAGEKNITRATSYAVRERDAADINKAVAARRSGYKGKAFSMISVLFMEEVVDKLGGKPREVTALKVFMVIIASLKMNDFRVDATPTSLSKSTKTALPNVSAALKTLEEIGAITVVRKGGKTMEILMNPYHGFKGHAHLHEQVQGQYEQCLRKIEKEAAETRQGNLELPEPSKKKKAG